MEALSCQPMAQPRAALTAQPRLIHGREFQPGLTADLAAGIGRADAGILEGMATVMGTPAGFGLGCVSDWVEVFSTGRAGEADTARKG